MLCSFVKTSKEFICENCGRRLDHHGSDRVPSAKCRTPERLLKKSKPLPVALDTIEQDSVGVGNILYGLLQQINVKYNIECSCSSKLTILNKKGCSWCEKNISTILKWMEEEASKQKIPFSKHYAKALIKLAIKKYKLYHLYKPN